MGLSANFSGMPTVVTVVIETRYILVVCNRVSVVIECEDGASGCDLDVMEEFQKFLSLRIYTNNAKLVHYIHYLKES